MNFSKEKFNSPDVKSESSSGEEGLPLNFKIGDTYINPVTEQPVKITFLGNKVYRFFLKNIDKQKQLFYEVIEGSEQYKQLKDDQRFEGEIVSTSVPSVELEWKTEDEDRRIVVAEETMNSFKRTQGN